VLKVIHHLNITILVIDSPTKQFNPSRRLIQGDLVAPFQFLIVAVAYMEW